MNTNEILVNNICSAIAWSNQKYFDKSFHSVTLSEVSQTGLQNTVSKYENYFSRIKELDTQDLPDESIILNLLNDNISLLTEDHFITGKNGVVSSKNQIFSAKQLIHILKNKPAFIVSK